MSKVGCYESASFRIETRSNIRLTRVALVVRGASSYINRHNAPCALTISWCASTGRTTGYIDGIAPSDLQSLVNLINSSSTFLGHPLTVVEIFLHLIVRNLNEVIRIPQEERYYLEELRTGLAVAHADPSEIGHYVVWGWQFQDFQDATTRANTFVSTLAYLQRRFQFARQVYRRLLSILEEFKTYEFESQTTKLLLDRGAHERRERLTNRLDELENYQHQCQCMQTRAENLIKVVRPPMRIASNVLLLITMASSILCSPKSTAEPKGACPKPISKSHRPYGVTAFPSEPSRMSLLYSCLALSSRLSMG